MIRVYALGHMISILHNFYKTVRIHYEGSIVQVIMLLLSLLKLIKFHSKPYLKIPLTLSSMNESGDKSQP